MPTDIQRPPCVFPGIGHDRVNAGGRIRDEREMVHTRYRTIMGGSRQGRRRRQSEVGPPAVHDSPRAVYVGV